MTIASPAVITKTNHGFVAGDQVIFSTTGTLPTGLTNYTRYFVLSTGLTTNTFRVSTTNGGSAVNTSGSQSGTHFIANAFTCRSGSAYLRPQRQWQHWQDCRPERTDGFAQPRRPYQ